MAAREDLRVTKTKEALTRAFYDILQETSLDDMTVNMLCDRAGVRRATFYKHFKDKTDFLSFLVRNVREQFDKARLSSGATTPITTRYYTEYAKELLRYFFQHNTAMIKILESNMRSTVIDIFLSQNFKDTKKRLSESVQNGMKLSASVDVVANMLIGGVSQNIISWFESENRMPLQSLLDDLSILIEKILR